MFKMQIHKNTNTIIPTNYNEDFLSCENIDQINGDILLPLQCKHIHKFQKACSNTL